jgi:hypothetical protein
MNCNDLIKFSAVNRRVSQQILYLRFFENGSEEGKTGQEPKFLYGRRKEWTLPFNLNFQ